MLTALARLPGSWTSSRKGLRLTQCMGWGWGLGRKHKAVLEEARVQGCSWGPCQEGSTPKVKVAKVLSTPTGTSKSRRGIRKTKKKWLGSEVPADLPGMEQSNLERCQWACQSRARGSTRDQGNRGLEVMAIRSIKPKELQNDLVRHLHHTFCWSRAS